MGCIHYYKKSYIQLLKYSGWNIIEIEHSLNIPVRARKEIASSNQVLLKNKKQKTKNKKQQAESFRK